MDVIQKNFDGPILLKKLKEENIGAKEVKQLNQIFVEDLVRNCG